MIIKIALVTAQSKGHCSLVIEIENKELYKNYSFV